MKTSTSNLATNQIFIGLAHVVTNKAAAGVLKGAKGAYVNILCLVLNEAEFIVEVSRVLMSMGLNLVDVEDIEKISERIKKYEIEDSLLSLADQLSEGKKVMFGRFHTYQ